MKKCVLELRNASYSYDGERHALNDISVKVFEGERVAVLGNNGAGKSTFFLCLNGVLQLQHGTLLFKDIDISHKKKDLTKLRSKVGFIFQDPDSQMIASTVESEVSFGLMNQNIMREDLKKRTYAVMQELDLMKYKRTPPHYLSGGEKKRVSIADILVMDPEVLLLDEPTAALDNKNIKVFEEILAKQTLKGITILSSTHDIDFAWGWADRILVFHDGKIIADDIPENIFANDQLLLTTSLQKPALYRFTEMLCENLKQELPYRIPKNECQLEIFIKELQMNN